MFIVKRVSDSSKSRRTTLQGVLRSVFERHLLQQVLPVASSDLQVRIAFAKDWINHRIDDWVPTAFWTVEVSAKKKQERNRRSFGNYLDRLKHHSIITRNKQHLLW